MQTVIYLVRHARSVGQHKMIRGRLPGYPLDDRGRQNAIRTAEYFRGKKIAAIFSSPLMRTRQTAEYISKVVKRKPILKREINEWDVWKIEGKKTIQLNPIELLFTFVFLPQFVPWGEKPSKVQKRMTNFIKRVLEEYQGKQVIVVSHRDCIMWARLFFQKLPINLHRVFKASNGSVTKLVFNGSELKKVEYIEP